MEQPAVTTEEMNRFLTAELPVAADLGIRCEELHPGVATMRCRPSPRHLRPGGYVNGGTLMTMADAAVYSAVFTRLGITPMAVTVELKMNFLRPAVGPEVVAVARLRSLGRRLAFAEVELHMAGDPDRLVAHATCTYALPAP